MLIALKGTANKMSKGDPDSVVFIEDSLEDLFRKV
jgi:tryptophanyl-tRNA synthetase